MVRSSAGPPRRLAVALAAVPLAAALLAAGTLAARGIPQTARHVGAPARTGGAQRADAGAARPSSAVLRETQVRALLARRSAAVLHRDRAAWMAGIDPRNAAFRKAQRAVFANLADVPIATWSYSMAGLVRRPGRAPVYDAQAFQLHYRLRGFDRRPTSLTQFPRFVRRGGTWYVTAFAQHNRDGVPPVNDLWDFGPVATVRTPRALVLGHPASLPLMRELAADVAADIPRVTAVWGRAWPRKAVILAPATQEELARVIGDGGPLAHIAAVTTAEVRAGPGRPDPVGGRIGINPANWSSLSALGRQVVLTHELTHLAARSVTSRATPTWLAEGLADYVGFRGTGLPPSVVAGTVAASVRAGAPPRHLPTASEFDGGSHDLSSAYERGWLACRLIAERYGEARLVRLYRVVSGSLQEPAAALAGGLRAVLHLTTAQFVAAWRAYVPSAIG